MEKHKIDETLSNLKTIMQEIKDKCIATNGLMEGHRKCQNNKCPFLSKNSRCGLALNIYYSNIQQRPINWNIEKLFNYFESEND